MIRQTQSDGGVYEFSYTLSGAQITQTDVTNPRGYIRRVTFDGNRSTSSNIAALGQSVERQTTYSRLSGSLVETETDELGRVSRFQYDAKGNVTSVTRLHGTGDAKTTSFTYDSTFGLATSITDPLNHTTSYAYDWEGRLTTVTDALSHSTTLTANGAGQTTSATNALSKTTTFTYELGDLTGVSTPLGNTETRFVDPAGRVLRVTDARGAVTRFEYDNLTRLTKIIDPLSGETTFACDANGNLLTLTDPRGKTTTWTYDNMDRVATMTDPLSRQESFTYDLNGNLKTWTDRKGQVTSYTYDALDRRIFIGFGTSGNPPTYASTIASTYDAGVDLIRFRGHLPKGGYDVHETACSAFRDTRLVDGAGLSCASRRQAVKRRSTRSINLQRRLPSMARRVQPLDDEATTSVVIPLASRGWPLQCDFA